LHEPDFVST